MEEPPIDDYPHGKSYGHLLTWHMKRGTRAEGSLKEWSAHTLGKAAFKIRENANGVPCDFRGKERTEESAKKNIVNWMKPDGAPPNKNFDDISDRILAVLFGKDPPVPAWRDDLINARNRYYSEPKAARTRLLAEGARRLTRQAGRRTTPQPAQATVPQSTPHFVGRDQERDKLVALLRSSDGPLAILVQGGPGIGKTELTKAVAHHPDVLARFGERRWFVTLETAVTAEEMRATIARAIGGDAGRDFRSLFKDLREKRSLLVLDNLETPWNGPNQQETEAILVEIAAIEGIIILASFRGSAVVGDVKWYNHFVQPLGRSSSVELFCSIAGRWALSDPNLDNFTYALGGVPLAIQLVARRAFGRRSLAPLWREWNRIGARLAEKISGNADKSTSLFISIEMSINSNNINIQGKKLFGLLGALPVGIHLDHVSNLIGSEEDFDAVDCLIRSGVAVERGSRIDLLPPVREHARHEHIPEDDDTTRWVDHYLGIVARYAEDCLRGGDRQKMMDITSDFLNIITAVKSKLSRGQIEDIISIIQVLARIIVISEGSYEIINDILEKVQAKPGLKERALCYWCLGISSFSRFDYETARIALQRSVDLNAALGNSYYEACSLTYLNFINLTSLEVGEA